MATTNLSSPLHAPSSLRLLSSYSPQFAPHLSFYSHPKSKPLPFSSISFKPVRPTRPRQLSAIVLALGKLAETEAVPVPPESEEFAGKFPSVSGVYAVYDENDDLQFVGISRNISASVLSHRKSVPELCRGVKVGVVDEPDRAALTQAWKSWMEEHIAATGKVPPGNESGNSTWVRQPPKKKSDLRLTPGRHVQLTVALEELIDRLVKENKVVAFIKGSRSAPQCGFSQRVVGILESEGVDYESIDVLDEEYNNGLRETLKKYSNWPTFPQVFVNGELVGGCDILSSMHEKGELAGSTDSASPSKVSTLYGVAGTIRMLAGTYVLAITSRKEVGSYLGFPVFRVVSMKFLSCNEGLRQLTSQEVRRRDEAYFMNLLKLVESTPGLYYSYQTDITLNLQRRFKLAEGWMTKPMWKQADPRFVWNRNLLEELIENKLDGFIMPLLQGNILFLFSCPKTYVASLNQELSFQTGQLKLKSVPATITLISRRCTRRLGTRMWRRGANLEGDTANFIETEQLLEFGGFRSSFLQSMVVERHFHDLLQRYGETVAVDLTDKHGDEGQLSMAFAAEMEKVPNARYVPFDFHRCCGNSNIDNIHLLYDQISDDFEKQGYFLLDKEGHILEEQKGIIRSNCIDCLDRTNVTQSYLARRSLDSQLMRVGALSSTESISLFNEDFEVFLTLWVEQGDEISLEYSGTHALKGDLVRQADHMTLIYDEREPLALQVVKFYLHDMTNFQDAIDLISGHYIINRSSPSPVRLNRVESFSYLPVASALLIGGLTVTSITLNHAGRNTQSFLSSVLCASAAAGMMALAKAHGRQICSRPRLCGLF
ncbi:hypothetical protein RJ639_004532 [Escallonia herrerae]|uniref:SAC domain-containing protein n=1 Tax=Escallonia herrerae TaxID=1293975 RepID=A0AA88VZT9_9ASTE|nr:hypothetical protein RJ639_004532 [Escallonia herrerae]